MQFIKFSVMYSLMADRKKKALTVYLSQSERNRLEAHAIKLSEIYRMDVPVSQAAGMLIVTGIEKWEKPSGQHGRQLERA